MTYFQPETLAEALEILASGKMQILAGGTDLFPVKDGPELGPDILDITRIDEIRGIENSGKGWKIGTGTTWAKVGKAELPPAFHALKVAATKVGSLQIQNSATVGGNLCNASPAADGVPPLMVLDAEIELASAMGRRRVALAEFLLGPRKTALRQGEIATAIHIPRSATAGASAFCKLGARKYLVISISMTAARIELDKDGRISRAALSVGACSPVAMRQQALEQALVGCHPDDPGPIQALIRKHTKAGLAPIDDVRADAGYRQQAAAELSLQAIREAARRAAL